MTIEVGELRALPVGRGQIGRVKYLALGKPGQGPGAGGGGVKVNIPKSVIKTGVKLPQIQMGGVRSQLPVDKPFYEQMRQELDQIAPTISDNPFMKNDKRKKLPYQRKDVNQATEINNNDNQDLSMVDELQAIQKDDLKRELCSVLKEIRKEEDDLIESLMKAQKMRICLMLMVTRLPLTPKDHPPAIVTLLSSVTKYMIPMMTRITWT